MEDAPAAAVFANEEAPATPELTAPPTSLATVEAAATAEFASEEASAAPELKAPPTSPATDEAPAATVFANEDAPATTEVATAPASPAAEETALTAELTRSPGFWALAAATAEKRANTMAESQSMLSRCRKIGLKEDLESLGTADGRDDSKVVFVASLGI